MAEPPPPPRPSPPPTPHVAPRVLLFDIMATVVREPFLDRIPAFFGLPRRELYPLLSREAWFAFERGEIDRATFGARFFRDGRPLDLDRLEAALVDGYDFLPGMERLLDRLHRAGAAIHALSNYPEWYRLIEAKLALSRFLDWRFVSCRTGVRKPDPEAFLGPARALGVAPGDCLLVDDRTDNCAAARAVGLQAIDFADAGALEAELVRVGVPLAAEPPEPPSGAERTAAADERSG
jgi:putative hydrolase of the HAD superfamily